MTNKERWLSGVTLMISILPFVLLAGAMQILPVKVEIPNLLAEESILIRKYDYMFMAVWCFVPMSLTLVARFLRIKGFVGRNFVTMTVASLCVGVAFLTVTLYVVLYHIAYYDINLIKTFDFFAAAAVILSLGVGLLANFLPCLHPNDMLGIKNKYTRSDNRVWVKVHYVSADVYMNTMFLLAVVSSALSVFFRFRWGFIQLILWVATMSGLICWSYLYSRHFYLRRHNGEKPPATK